MNWKTVNLQRIKASLILMTNRSKKIMKLMNNKVSTIFCLCKNIKKIKSIQNK